ncbi:hypothetical protein T11_18449 [Trichinella zimbabwensis]|uniref:Uncharacterized protein n=1 Tax=Trichinella zimbabwensis TaxID=268475 RepID=A0A0V1I706_9BILA|nr:hypothetical protein T11_18449 [Trichinella zimbabwensis]
MKINLYGIPLVKQLTVLIQKPNLSVCIIFALKHTRLSAVTIQRLIFIEQKTPAKLFRQSKFSILHCIKG